jgi:hypothetical protein
MRLQTEKGKIEKMKPSIGRIVHYQAFGTPKGEYPSVPRAAVITQVWEQTALVGGDDDESEEATLTGEVGLAILNPTGMFFQPKVPYSETPKPGHWNWPPRSG